MSKNIAIVGASGTVGKYITEALVKSKNPFTITAITRKESKKDFPEGVKAAIVDYNDEESIVAALKGQDALIITLAIQAPPETQSILVKAAAKAKVPYVFPNEFTFEFDTELNHAQVEDVTTIYSIKGAARKQIEDLGVSKWIGISHGFWYEFSLISKDFESFGIVIKDKKAVIIGDGNTKLKATTWHLVGEAFERILSRDLAQYGNTQISFNSFLVSQNDILDSVLRVTKDTRENWSIKNVDEREWLNESVALFATNPALAFGRSLYARQFFKDQKEFGEKYNKLQNKELGLEDEDLDEATQRGVDLINSGYQYP